MSAPDRARRRIDVAFDRRCTSHMSAGMTLYVRKLVELLPQVAPDLNFGFAGGGDNFDAAEQIGLPLTIARMHPRLAHIPTPFVPIALPARFVLTIHDLIDLEFPQFGKRKVGPYYRVVVGPQARRACAVITDDGRTIGDLERFLGVDPKRVRVVPLGVDLAAPAAPPESRGRPFFLYVGNHRPHKNLATLVRAWSMLPPALVADLVLTGTPDGSADLPNVDARAGGNIVFVGDCADAELVALYRAARAYVQPALREGFGLPMLEAMRAGTPVFAAHSAVPQVLASHVRGFDALDAFALRDLLVSALVDPEPLRAPAVLAQAATRALTWEQTARATAAIYREFFGVIDVAIDARVTRRMSFGMRAYLSELLARLPAAAPDLRVIGVGLGENFGVAEQIGLPRQIACSGAKAVHYPTMFAPLVRTRPYVLTVHDLIHLRYAGLFGRSTALHYRLVGMPLARGARRLLMGDARTIADCERYLGVAPERCRVVPLGYDPALLERDEPLITQRPFLFYAGNHKPHKNLAALYAAWAAIAPQRTIDLRVTGAADTEVLQRYTRVHGTLVFTGHLTPRELRQHYRAALGYVHPAFTEGFGIPLLEAAVVGTPVIASASAIPALLEPYAVTFEASDVPGLTALLDDLVRDPAPFAARAAEGAVPLRAYTWDRFATGTAAVYREVIQCL